MYVDVVEKPILFRFGRLRGPFYTGKSIFFFICVIAVAVLFLYPKDKSVIRQFQNPLVTVLVGLLGGVLVIVQLTFGVWSSYGLRRLNVLPRAERGVKRFGIDLGDSLQATALNFVFF